MQNELHARCFYTRATKQASFGLHTGPFVILLTNFFCKFLEIQYVCVKKNALPKPSTRYKLQSNLKRLPVSPVDSFMSQLFGNSMRMCILPIVPKRALEQIERL